MIKEKEILVQLSEYLGFSRAKKIQARVFKKYGKQYSISYINMVLNPDHVRFNETIFKEAFLLAKKLKADSFKNRAKMLKEVKNLSRYS